MESNHEEDFAEFDVERSCSGRRPRLDSRASDAPSFPHSKLLCDSNLLFSSTCLFHFLQFFYILSNLPADSIKTFEILYLM